jgi:tetratricopeptide (TPR) repeat protein
MKTIRRYSNVAEAGFAQSLLEAGGIDATLADEQAGTLGGQFVPWGIRLEVAEGDVERALEILDRPAGSGPLPPGASPQAIPPSDKETAALILAEIRHLRISNQVTSVFFILLLIAAVLHTSHRPDPPSTARQRLPQTQTDSWEAAQAAYDGLDYEQSSEIVQRIIAKYPNDYYGYEYLGHIALATGRLQEAEGYYAHACALLPTEENEKKLRAIQKRLEIEGPK